MSKAKLVKPSSREDVAIAAGIAADPDAMELSDAQFAGARRRGRPPGRTDRAKQLVSVRLDPEVIHALRASGPRWQSRVNALLRMAFVPGATGLPKAEEEMAGLLVQILDNAVRIAELKQEAQREVQGH